MKTYPIIICVLFALASLANSAVTAPPSTNRPASSPQRYLVLSSETFRHLSPSTGPAKRLIVYSLDHSQRAVATNSIDPGSAQPLLNVDNNQVHIIPSDLPGAAVPSRLTKTRVTLPSRIGLTREVNNTNLTLSIGDLFLNALESPLRWNANS